MHPYVVSSDLGPGNHPKLRFLGETHGLRAPIEVTNSSCFCNTCVEYDCKDALTDPDRRILLVVFRCMANERPIGQWPTYHLLSIVCRQSERNQKQQNQWQVQSLEVCKCCLVGEMFIPKCPDVISIRTREGLQLCRAICSTWFNYLFMPVEQRLSLKINIFTSMFL